MKHVAKIQTPRQSLTNCLLPGAVLALTLVLGLFPSRELVAETEVLQVLENFDSAEWSEEAWVFSHNVVRSRVNDGQGGQALSMVMNFAERLNGYG